MENRKRCRQQGFTLIELMITLTIIGITLFTAIPSFSALLANNRLVATLNEFNAVMSYARSEAIKRGTRVVLCPTADNLNCAGINTWQETVLLFVDTDADADHDEEEPLLRIHRPPNDQIGIYSGSKSKITYQSNGSSPGSNLTLTFCDPDQKAAPIALILANSGRLRSSDKAADGSVLSCP